MLGYSRPYSASLAIRWHMAGSRDDIFWTLLLSAGNNHDVYAERDLGYFPLFNPKTTIALAIAVGPDRVGQRAGLVHIAICRHWMLFSRRHCHSLTASTT